MGGGRGLKREVPWWWALVAVIIVLAAAAWFYRGQILPPKEPDIFSLDARNPQNVALFRQLDAYYKEHPEKKPRNWPPPQFTEEAIARAQAEHQREFAEAERKRAKVIEEYLKQSKPQGR